MAQDGKPHEPILRSPAVAALRQEFGYGLGDDHRHRMERSFSQDIQEGSLELKEAAELTRNIILDLGLDGIIRWVSPSWTDVVGTDLEVVKDQPISRFIADDPHVFEPAIEALKSNTSKSHFVKFSIRIGKYSKLADMVPNEQMERQDPAPEESEKLTLELEGQGIMVYDRGTGGESHTMWMLQPSTEPVRVEFALPERLMDVLGVGAELLAKYLNDLAENAGQGAENLVPPLPILCRICERSVVPWLFEKHSDLCVQEHKAEMSVQMIQENLSEHRHAIVKILDAFEARQGRLRPGDASPQQAIAEYKGLPISPSPISSSAVSSTPGSALASPDRSRSPSASGLASTRPRSFIVRRPLVRVVELILDLCDTALEINIPSFKDSRAPNEEEFKAQSPQSESRIAQVMHWQQPSSLEHEPGLAALSSDTEKLARQKVEAVHRHQIILEYSERIRSEYIAEVDACITEAMIKAERAAAGEALSSSESDAELQTPVDERVLQEEEEEEEGEEEVLDDDEEEQATPMPKAPEPVRATSYVGMRSIANAFRSTQDFPPLGLPEPRRPSSQAVSTGSNSPAECPTPKSHRGTGAIPISYLSNRRSAYVEDGTDSDAGSFLSSSMHSGIFRPDSPASNSDAGQLGRSASSRERKRRSMHLHGLGGPSPHRQHSPGRYPLPPSSPLRLAKPRLGSGDLASSSPMVSPLVTTGEFMQPNPPGQQSNHHRRQSSVNFSPDGRAPSSPRMGSLSQPAQRAQPPSIKDFEIIKPISRGAFGSVYLSKKKITGEYFAVKVLRKSDMVAKNQVTNVKAERAIMMWQGESDFVAKLYWTFSSKDYLYLVMEYLNGGDCASLVKILGGLTEDWAKKYVAEVVLGVQHLHDRGIVHRDLKPDNLLIDSKGHLKLTDFGLSRMGLVGRQKRALKGNDEGTPDLLKQGPFTSTESNANSKSNSRSASFDFHGQELGETPFMTPALAGGLEQPSYFSLSRENSIATRDWHRRASELKRSDSGSSHDFQRSFKNLSLAESGDSLLHLPPFRSSVLDDDTVSRGSNSPDLFPLSQSMSNISQAPLPPPTQDVPLPTALYDPSEAIKRFVGTPDYLAPETINGKGQDEMCDWWALGCILFEFIYGFPPFNADSTEEVFDNILNRRIAWPDDEEVSVSDEARDLMNSLMRIDPQERLGANVEDKFPNGGAQIQAHPWFTDINWSTLLEDEAQFIPNPENPEDTEYFDARGATLQSFPEELEDQLSPAHTPHDNNYPDRPHDALLRSRTQIGPIPGTTKRGLMPLHIPPHVARDHKNRRLSEPVIMDDFGTFTFKNLPVLEKANKDIVEKMRKEAMQAQARGYALQVTAATNNSASNMNSPVPSLEGSPMLPMPVKRALSISKGHRPGSPSGFGNPTSSPSRPSQPSSPLLVQFSVTPHHERRKTSSSSHSSGSLLPSGFFDLGKEVDSALASGSSSPIKSMRQVGPSPGKTLNLPSRQTSLHRRHRSHTVGSQDSDQQLPAGIREPFVPGHYKRKSQLFARDLSPSSSDNESVQAKALLKVQRRRQSSRRMSQINFLDGPMYRPLDVLIGEDHPVSKMVLERLFEKLKCRTITASNGPEVLRYAVSQIQFDIIFMEFKLPLINGVDVARMIRDTKSANTTTPIVCVTGYLKDLPDVHHFDALLQKPPTVAKLTEELCKFCSWKPPPKDFRLSQALMIPPITRLDMHHTQDSPSSVASSLAPTMPDSSYRGSSREDSLGSVGFFSDYDSVKADEQSGPASRVSTSEWSKAGLGISDDPTITQKSMSLPMPIIPSLIHSDSAPPVISGSGSSSMITGEPLPMQSSLLNPNARSSDKHRREPREQRKPPTGRGDEGDDEDDVLGDLQVRARSPAGKMIRQTSKLGTEMMRTNSRGSVISVYDDRSAESESLRRSLELLEERIESYRLTDPEEPAPRAQPPPRTVETPSPHTQPKEEEAMSGGPLTGGHITPPVIFPQAPGDKVKEIDMDAITVPSSQIQNRSRPVGLEKP